MMKMTTKIVASGATMLALGGGGLFAVFAAAGPAGAQVPSPAITNPVPTAGATTPGTPAAPETAEAPGAPDTDTIQDQAGDQSGPNDTTGPDTAEAPGAADAGEAPGAPGA